MKRPLLVWLAFAACALTGFGVLTWFTREMLRYERASDEARRLAAIEENTRLALWRMDSALAGIHGVETARSWQDYEPFYNAEGAFTRDLAPLPTGTVMLPSSLLGFTPPFVRLHFQIDPDGTIRSPQSPVGALRDAAIAAGVTSDRLNNAATSLVELRGRIANGELAALRTAAANSLAAQEKKEIQRTEEMAASKREADRDAQKPETVVASGEMAPPAENNAPQAAPVVAETPPEQKALPPQEVAQTIQVGKSYAEQQQRQDLLTVQNEVNVGNRRRGNSLMPRDGLADAAPGYGNTTSPLPVDGFARAAPAMPATANAPAPSAAGSYDSAGGRAGGEIALDEGRAAASSPVPAGPTIPNSDTAKAAPPPAINEMPKDTEGDLRKTRSVAPEPPATATVTEGPMQALWVSDELVFARRVVVGDRTLVQGAWLDWNELRAWLLSRVTDLLPSARLERVSEAPSKFAFEATRRLAFIPAQLVPGPVSVGGDSSWSPLQVSLSAAWISAALGAFALALLLRGTLRLSERRGAFVSAVTHELRTPLTTFRMYTEMLAGGMVPDETKRRGYIDTLRKEAERLSHLVENVLSYARLERGRASARIEETTPGALLARIEERLLQRAQQGGIALRVSFADGAAELPLRTDTTAVEQILFNLVDNAAKYARRADGAGELVIDVARANERTGGIVVRVSDNGPGIATSVRRRLFQPFSKSATEAAQSQPGVGLGLALSRRLARDELHGELALERTGPNGTVFRLELPLV